MPFTVSNSSSVLNSHTTLPLVVSYARRWPSRLPENATPGIALTAWGWPVLHPVRPAHVSLGGAADHRFVPSATLTATIPPASPGFFSSALESATKAVEPSVANPHSMPPSTPPSPACVFHTISPVSGLSPYNAPDF